MIINHSINIHVHAEIKKPKIVYEEKINKDLLEDVSIRGFYTRSTHYLTQEQDITNNVENMWHNIKNNILKAADEALGRRRVKVPTVTKYKIPWYTEM